MEKIQIKNMVCDRCIHAVRKIFNPLEVRILHIDLGQVTISDPLNESKMEELERHLEKDGFELLKERQSEIITGVKYLVIGEIHQKANRLKGDSFPGMLAKELGLNYAYISKLFSQVEGQTLEQYIIKQKIEKAKELISYEELTFSEISYELNYSSVQHFSRQFKQMTGMTPSEFKQMGGRQKLDKI